MGLVRFSRNGTIGTAPTVSRRNSLGSTANVIRRGISADWLTVERRLQMIDIKDALETVCRLARLRAQSEYMRDNESGADMRYAAKLEAIATVEDMAVNQFGDDE